MRDQPTEPQWVCEHCYIHLVNGDCTDALHTEPDASEEQCGEGYTIPLSEFGDMLVTAGMLSEHHDCLDADGERADECECETDPFSWTPCDGCGGRYGGSRYAVTGWIKEGPTDG